ncbi:MAG: hypothetical protein JOY78_19450 [Pseudonocardia sp.]|nr:hypothetical protein [Pseudonocardia sp.]
MRSRPDREEAGACLLTVEDWGIGMTPEALAATNVLLADAPELDMSVSQRLGFHVVARLAARHGIHVSLSATPGSGVTALVRIPAALTTDLGDEESKPITAPVPVTAGREPQPVFRPRPLARPLPQPRAQSRPQPSSQLLPHPEASQEPPVRPQPTPLPQRPTADSSRPVREASPWDAAGWDGWWAPPAPETDEAVGPTTAADPAAAPALRRRVPQTHLVEQLRVDSDADGPSLVDREAQAARDAADALTRYQAARSTASRDGRR